jgi:isopenicillin N synthase-like dioxygenase
MQDIPLIDIAPFTGGTDRNGEDVIRQVEEACRDVGFMYVVGHGIPSQTVARTRNAVIAYFKRSIEEKLGDAITRDNYRGYIPAGFFTANVGGSDSDNYEGYKLHFETSADDPICAQCDLYGPNKWPAAPAGFGQAILDYWSACDDVAFLLLRILATVLRVDENWFLQLFEKPLTNMTLLHYPPQQSVADGFGIHPHKDTDALTILAADEVGGLMVKRRNNDTWIEVQPPGDALVVNIGDLLEHWSGGDFVSTPHKVVNTSGTERFSFPYFVVPRFDTVVKPLRPPKPDFQRDSVHVGDVSREVWRTNWPDAAPQSMQFDLGTLED